MNRKIPLGFRINKFVLNSYLFTYLGESKVLQYFGNVRQNLAVLDYSSEIVKMANHTEFVWYSPCSSCWICLYGFEIHSYRPTWSCSIVMVRTTQVNFLGSSHYSTIINCIFSFRTTNVLGCFQGLLSLFGWGCRICRLYLC